MPSPSAHSPIIGIDCRFAATQSGIGRYTRELVRHLLQRDDPWKYVLFVHDEKEHGLHPLPTSANAQLLPCAVDCYSWKEHIVLPHVIRRTHIDLFHAPHFNTPYFCPAPCITTIHDLILHSYPNNASSLKRLAYHVLMKRAVSQSTHIISVSNFTAGELCKYYGSHIEEKMSVMYEGVSDNFHPVEDTEKRRVRTTYQLPDHFVLYIGASKEHKNVQTLIDACPNDRLLVLVTGGNEAEQLQMRENTRILSSVPDADLPALYCLADVFVSPSFSEGFNLPVLEAMACECPVIATQCGSTPEICGAHAILVEPTVESLHTALAGSIAVDRVAAKQHAAQFSWKNMADETAMVYGQHLSCKS